MKHLDLDICKKLKAAGFPQESCWAYDRDGVLVLWDGDPGLVACPNTDSLLASIIGGNRKPKLTVDVFPGEEPYAAYLSVAVTLANLYLSLTPPQ